MKRISRAAIVVTVEHASWRVPAALADLGLPRSVLTSHVGWDPGAATVGRGLARAFDAPLHLGRFTRLLADLNRSAHHPRVVPDDIRPSGRRIRTNELDRAGRERRLARYWRPWRAAVGVDLDRAIARCGLACHLSVHSFVERLRGIERRFDIGLLYDPSRPREAALADRLDARLTERGLRVRRNRPYTGREDGHCMRMRAERPAREYIGMEIEMNQRRVRDPGGARRLARELCDALAPEFDDA